MISKVFSVYDSKAEAYLAPFFMPTEGMAVRAFTEHVQNPEAPFGKNPEDYTLFCLGTFNDSTCEADLHAPKSVGNGIEYLLTSQPTLPPGLTTVDLQTQEENK